MRCIQCVGDLDAQSHESLGFQRLVPDPMLQSGSLEKLHDDERATILLPDVVNRADVRMIQGGRRASLSPETVQGLGVAGEFIGQKLESDKAVESRVLSFVDHAHTAAAE